MKYSLLEKIRKLCELHHDSELWRILVIAAYEGGWEDNNLFYCPDDILEKGIDSLLE